MTLSRLSFAVSSWSGVFTLLVAFFSICTLSLAAVNVTEVQTTDGSYVPDDRRPSLYTQNFGDCQGDSLVNVTRFDAAYYKDNMTVLFHLAGNTAVANESLMRESSISSTAIARLTVQFISVSSPTVKVGSI